MTIVGMFGKMPSFGDFVSMGSGSPLHRGFERWLEDSNDVLATRRQELAKDPLGFMIRGEDSTSMLVGILVGSCDSVGRTFPLGVFHEISATKASLAGLPLAMARDLARLASVARKARTYKRHEIEALLREPPRLSDEQTTVLSHAELQRLRIVRGYLLLERVFGLDPGPGYAISVIERACELAEERSGRTPLLLQGRANTDVELMFSLALLDAMSGGRQPHAVLWDVRTRRVLFVLGPPDQGLLALMVESSHVERLWPMTTDRADVAQKAADALDARLRSLLEDAKVGSSKDLVDALAAARKAKQPLAQSKEKRSLWRSRDP